VSNDNLNWADVFSYDYRVLGCDILEPSREVLTFWSNLLPHFHIFTLNMVYPVVLKRRNSSVKLPGVTANCAVNSVFIVYVLQNYWAPNQNRNRSLLLKFCIYRTTRRHIP
jgi:hypothetical protein